MRARIAATLLTATFVCVTCVGLVLTTTRASAVFHDLAETGQPGLLGLRIHSQTPLWATLAPGDSMHWWIEAALEDTTSGTLAVEMRSAGRLPEISGMTAEVLACSGEFDIATHPPTCTGVLETALAATPLTQVNQHDGRYDLVDLHGDDPRHVLVTLTMPSSVDGEAIAGQSAHVGLGVHAAGESPSLAPPAGTSPAPGGRHLTATGADALALGLLAAGLIGLGAIARTRGRTSALGDPP